MNLKEKIEKLVGEYDIDIVKSTLDEVIEDTLIIRNDLIKAPDRVVRSLVFAQQTVMDRGYDISDKILMNEAKAEFDRRKLS